MISIRSTCTIFFFFFLLFLRSVFAFLLFSFWLFILFLPSNLITNGNHTKTRVQNSSPFPWIYISPRLPEHNKPITISISSESTLSLFFVFTFLSIRELFFKYESTTYYAVAIPDSSFGIATGHTHTHTHRKEHSLDLCPSSKSTWISGKSRLALASLWHKCKFSVIFLI